MQELDAALQQQLRTHNVKVDKFQNEQTKITEDLKEKEKAEKKSGARPSYEQ